MPADGNYEFHVSGNAFTPALADELVQNDFFLNADFDHNRAVDFADYLKVATNYNGTGKSFSQGDTDGNGTVNFADNLLVSKRYNTRLAAAPTYAGEVTVGSEALSLDNTQPDGTLTPLTISFARVADTLDDPNTTANESVTIAGYSVYRSNDGESFTALADVPRDGETATYTYSDTTAVDGAKY